MSSRLVQVTRVRRCLEEARGGLELAWRGHVALALQGICETKGPDDVLPVEITGHTTPAVADVGRASLRVRFVTAASASSSASTSIDGGSAASPTGGLLLGIRKSPLHRWVPCIAAAPGDKGPDRYSNSRDGLAELMIMARPAVTVADDGEDATASRQARDASQALARGEADASGDAHARSRAGTTSLRTPSSCLLTCLDDETLREWMPAGHRAAEVVVVRRVTDFHLGLNANRWLKIRMKQIADGFEPLFGDDRGTGGASGTSAGAGDGDGDGDGAGTNTRGGGTRRVRREKPQQEGVPIEKMNDEDECVAAVTELLRGTGLELDPSAEVSPRPADAAHLFEHWGAGGNTGISGQVTGWET